jgi:acyl carrier protein
MIPSAFMMIGQLPLLPFGKVNRGALPAPDWAQPNTSADYTAPNGLVEERLVKIWVDILGVRQVGTQDNFFELGGTSLTVTQLILQILQEFKIELNIQQIYENPSVAQQAREIESSQQGKETRITTSEEELKQAIRRLGF